MIQELRTPEVSVVLPVRDERENLEPLLIELQRALAAACTRFEVIAIDDGSTDGSDVLLKQFTERWPWLTVAILRRNYGQSAAFDAGFKAARGSIIVTMDADGQNDPADLARMLDAVRSGRCDFVAGRRLNRQDGWVLRRLPSLLANALIRFVTGTRLHDLGCSLKVYRREYIQDLHLYGEMHRFIGVLIESMGARTEEMEVHHRPRTSGRSKYGLERTVKVCLDLITVWFMRGYQTKPIYVFGGTGLILGAISFLLAAYVLYEKLAQGTYVHRNPLFILAVIVAVIGVQFLALGLLAEIMVRTYFESQGHPCYRVREWVRRPPARPQVHIALSNTPSDGANRAGAWPRV